jgi:hypothetical protein
VTPDEHRNLVRVLADFACWLETNQPANADMGYYRTLARHYIETGGVHELVDVPHNVLAWCDLCGRQFSKEPTHMPEQLTGSNYCWCPTCLLQQSQVCFMLGAEQYQAAWTAQEGRD